MTRSQTFSAAHEIAALLAGDYRNRFTLALCLVRRNPDAVAEMKSIINDQNK